MIPQDELDAAAKALPLLATAITNARCTLYDRDHCSNDWRNVDWLHAECAVRAALTAAADVRRQRDDDYERVDCSACDGSGCEHGCGALADGCQDAYSGPDSHKVCPKCHGTGNGEPSAVGTQSSDTGALVTLYRRTLLALINTHNTVACGCEHVQLCPVVRAALAATDKEDR